MKTSREFQEFNSAMDTILKADPVKVKAEMEAEKREREEQRKTRSLPSAVGRASNGKD